MTTQELPDRGLSSFAPGHGSGPGHTPSRSVGALETAREDPPAGSGRTWTIQVAACEWLTANDRRRPIELSGIIRDWRTSVFYSCTAARLPKGITPVRIHADVYYVGRAPVRDRANLSPTIKAIVDGLAEPRTFVRHTRRVRTIGYGLISDDSDKHVLSTTWELSAGILRPRVLLTITEVLG